MFAAPSTLELPLPDGEVWAVTNAGGAGLRHDQPAGATVDSVNTVYAQLIERLGAQRSSRWRTADGDAVLPAGQQSAPTAPPTSSAVLGANEVEHPRDGVARTGRSPPAACALTRSRGHG